MNEETPIPPAPATQVRRSQLRVVNVQEEHTRKRSAMQVLAERSEPNAEPLPAISDLSEVRGTWLDHLLWTRRAPKGEEPTYVPASTVANANLVLTSDLRWKGVIAYDEFAECIVKTRMPPWHAAEAGGAKLGDWTETDTTRLEAWLYRAYGIKLGDSKIDACVSVASDTNRIHPVRAYLRGLEWDGIRRIHHWLSYLLGAPDTPYVHEVGRLWLIGAVARIMSPGCKVDTMLVLEGKTGIRKSLALRTLAGDAWFTEISSGIDPLTTPQLLRRKWIVELGELAALRRTKDYETIKSFLSRQEDNYRPPYGRRARDFPRQSVFAGSTNEERYLRDATGARRFWPITCGIIQLRNLQIERDQLWAEAVHEYDEGQRWHIEDDDLVAAAVSEQSARYEEDAWTEIVREWCGGSDGGVARERVGVTVEEVLGRAICLEVSRWTMADYQRAGTVLRRIGWVPKGAFRPRRYKPESYT